LIGSGKKAQAEAAAKEKASTEKKEGGKASQDSSRRTRREQMEDLTAKITSTPLGGIRPARLAAVPETTIFGLPTVRSRKPGFVKRLSDNTVFMIFYD
jgi:hypothetical protein